MTRDERDNRGWAVFAAILVVGIGFVASGVRQWLAGFFSQVGPDRSADAILMSGACLMGGIVLSGATFLAVYFFVRRPHHVDSPPITIDQPPAPQLTGNIDLPAWTTMQNGRNSTTMLPTSQIVVLADRAVRELKPAGISPTQANLIEAFGISSGTASAIQGKLRDWQVANVSDGVASTWK